MAIETVHSPFGYSAETATSPDGTVGVKFLGRSIGPVAGLPFSPETNDRGDLAYASSSVDGPKGSDTLSDIYLNGERIAKDRPVLDMAMNNDVLVWLEIGGSGSVLLRYDLRSGELSVEKLPVLAERIVVDGDRFVATGVTPAGDTVVLVSSRDGPTSVVPHDGPTIFLTGNASGATLVRVTGDQAGQLLYAALDRFLRTQTEELGQTNNEAGRLAWHQSYRLMAAADLAAATGSAELKARAVAAAMEILDRADANGNFPSIRYSLGEESVSFSGHSAFIYRGAFASYDWMTPSQKQRLVEQAEKSFASFEADWFSYGYRFTPGSDFYLDGVVQPFNLQSAMGLMALDLYRVTQKPEYLDRVEAIWSNITSELMVEGGAGYWRYWPKLFSDGWIEGVFDSINAPSAPPTPVSSYDDVYHAAVTIRFLLAAADALQQDDVIDPEVLFQSVHLGGLTFAASLAGSSGGYEFLPPWPDARSLWPFLTRDLPTLLARYDSGIFDWMYASAARQSGVATATTVRIERLDPGTGEVIETLTLTGPDEILAFVQSQRYVADAEPGSIHMASASNDAYQGSANADQVRLLDGDDHAVMGGDDDTAMGDYGADRLFGEGGADELFGGFGDDILSGGSGDDVLFGQAGDDTLLGGDGADTLFGGGGNDTIDGGPGFDVVVFGSRRGVQVVEGPEGVITITGPDGTDTLTNVEEIRFSDAIKWTFEPPSTWTRATPDADGWSVGDFNGDGRDDIFRYAPGISGADMFLSNGGGFESDGSWTPAGNGSDGWYVGDFNGDGKDDIFRYMPGRSGAEVFLSNGAGFVSAGSWTPAGKGTDDWYVGDFNGDGNDDIFRYMPGRSGAEVFLSNGAGFVSAGSWTPAGKGTDDWYVGDFNGDGKDDIFRYLEGTSGADTFLSSGNDFAYAGSWTHESDGSDKWYVGDFNGDGNDDLLRYLPGKSGGDVLLSNGAKFAADGSWTSVGFGSDGWYLGDFNGDGNVDLMGAMPAGAYVLI